MHRPQRSARFTAELFRQLRFLGERAAEGLVGALLVGAPPLDDLLQLLAFRPVRVERPYSVGVLELVVVPGLAQNLDQLCVVVVPLLDFGKGAIDLWYR